MAAQWVIWNGSLGVLDMVMIGRIEEGGTAYLAPPYDMVGPFSMTALESEGRIFFGACMVMSRQRWREDQAELRAAAFKQRRAFFLRATPGGDDRPHRAALGLAEDGALTTAEINTAFRRLAKTAHPDAGGSNERYREIVEAREVLLERFGNAA